MSTNTIKATVTLPDHRCLVLYVPPTATLHELKKLVRDQMGHSFADTAVVSGGKRYADDSVYVQELKFEGDRGIELSLVSDADQRTEDGTTPILLPTTSPTHLHDNKCKVCKKQLITLCVSCNKAFCVNCTKKSASHSREASFVEDEKAPDVEMGRNKFVMVQCLECARERHQKEDGVVKERGKWRVWLGGWRLGVLVFLLLVIAGAVIAVCVKRPGGSKAS
ncbi:hypothetical protein HDU79_001921 [Rhizoclosmatium sp. JEL0117]|nr:hypothetical protein HDU79_001921 [Rhizoclosmatium sp. JEL0117]